MAQFQFVDTSGGLQTIEAADAQAAMAAATNIAPNSGVMAVPGASPAAGPTTDPAAAQGAATGSDAFFKELSTRLLGDKGGTSSVNPVAGAVDSAVKDLQAGLKAAQVGIKAKYQQQRDRLGYDFEQATTGAREGMMNLGGASTMAILTQYDERNRRALNDLNLAEQQALAAGQYEVATKIADLKIQRAQSQMEFEQRSFQNLFQAAQLYMQRDSQTLDFKRFQADQDARIAEIALKYGLDIQPGETLNSMIKRASVGASEDRKLELERARAELAQTYAQTAAANRSNRGGQITEADRMRSAFSKANTALSNSITANMGRTAMFPDYIKARLSFIQETGDPQAKDIFDANFGNTLSVSDQARAGVNLLK